MRRALLIWCLLLAGIVCIAQSEHVNAFWQSRDSNYNQNIVSSGGGTTTFDPANKNASLTLSNGNLTVTQGGSSYTSVRSIASHSTGKFYWELTLSSAVSGAGDFQVGIVNSSEALSSYIGGDNNGGGSWGNSGNFFTGGGTLGTIPGFNPLDTVGIAVDLGAQLIWVRDVTVSSTTWNAGGTANPATGLGGVSFSNITGPYFIAVSINTSPEAFTLNAGGSSYAASAPALFGNY